MNIYDAIKEVATRFSDRQALTTRVADGSHREFSYAEVLQKVNDYSNHLTQLDLEKGDRVALVAENSPEWVIAFLAILACNCTAVLVEASLTGQEICKFLEMADAHAYIMSQKAKEKVDAVKTIGDVALRLDDLDVVANASYRAADTDPEAAVILFSSGTTSTPKGVIHTHDKILISTRGINEIYKITCKDKFLAVLPQSHIYGFVANVLCPLLSGGSAYYLQNVTSDGLELAFKEYKPTKFCCVPPVFDLFANKIRSKFKSFGKAAGIVLNCLLGISFFSRKVFKINIGKMLFKQVHEVFGGEITGLMSGGAPIKYDTSKLFYSLGFYLFSIYGSTEATYMSVNYYDHYTLNTNGCPFIGVNIMIKDPDDEGNGEIVIFSEWTTKGYFRDEEAMRDVVDGDGGFHTGDIGRIDKKGNLLVTGRLKDVIVLPTGTKVSPGEVEAAYSGIAGVRDLVVCGVPKAAGGADEVHAFIVLENDEASRRKDIESQIISISAQLQQQLRISKMHFVNKIEKTALGKPKRYLLKEYALSLNSDTTDQKEKPREAKTLIREVLLRLYPDIKEIPNGMRVFEEIGMDSITATEFCAVLENKTGVNIASFLTPNITVDDMATMIENGAKSEGLEKYPHNKGTVEWMVFKAFGWAFRLFYKFEVTGKENLPQGGGYIICPNHQTHLDGLWIFMHMERESFFKWCSMAKAEHAENPLGRLMLKVAGGIPVDRYGNPSPALMRCREELDKGKIILIHPEGTRTPDGKIHEFKKGAASLSVQSGKSIIPVTIQGGYEVYPKGRPLPKLFNFAKMKRYKIQITFGDALRPDGSDIESLTDLLYKSVAGVH